MLFFVCGIFITSKGNTAFDHLVSLDLQPFIKAALLASTLFIESLKIKFDFFIHVYYLSTH